MTSPAGWSGTTGLTESPQLSKHPHYTHLKKGEQTAHTGEMAWFQHLSPRSHRRERGMLASGLLRMTVKPADKPLLELLARRTDCPAVICRGHFP